jgi:hypothetical protein
MESRHLMRVFEQKWLKVRVLTGVFSKGASIALATKYGEFPRSRPSASLRTGCGGSLISLRARRAELDPRLRGDEGSENVAQLAAK